MVMSVLLFATFGAALGPFATGLMGAPLGGPAVMPLAPALWPFTVMFLSIG